MPLIRRIPKRGFNNEQFRMRYGIVNLADIEQFEAGTQVDEAFLREHGLVRGSIDGVKILGLGELTKNFNVHVNRVSSSARAGIEKAGGTVRLK